MRTIRTLLLLFIVGLICLACAQQSTEHLKRLSVTPPLNGDWYITKQEGPNFTFNRRTAGGKYHTLLAHASSMRIDTTITTFAGHQQESSIGRSDHQ